MTKEQEKLVDAYKAGLVAQAALKELVLAQLPQLGTRVQCNGIDGVIIDRRLEPTGFAIRLSGYTEDEETWLNGHAFDVVRELGG